MTKFNVLIFILFFSLSQSTTAQIAHNFDITVAGFTIGEMRAKSWDAGDTTYYELRSEVSFWLFGQIKVDYLTEVVYVGKRLLRSKVESSTNRGDFLSRVWLDRDRYRVDANSYKYELKTTIEEPITYSAVRLFFEEPKEMRMLAENYGVFGHVEPRTAGVFDSFANGNKNRYEYQDGKLMRAIMQNPIKNYVIKRK